MGGTADNIVAVTFLSTPCTRHVSCHSRRNPFSAKKERNKQRLLILQLAIPRLDASAVILVQLTYCATIFDLDLV